ncbi:MAG: hypothetical protein RIB98_15455 [Acidimicrobiales bacterium]
MTAVFVALALLAAACSDGDGDADADPGSSTTIAETPTTTASTTTTTPPSTAVDVAEAGACDPVDGAACLLPWPNDRFTAPDDGTVTGLRIDFPADATPANADGVHIGVDEWNRNDGFSPAAMPMTVIPGIDPVASGLAPVTDIARSLADDSPLVLFDTATGERVPAWAELDFSGTDDTDTALVIVPAIALGEGHRHLVVLRDLVDVEGNAIEPSDAFVERVSAPADQHDQALLEGLDDAGIDPAEVTVAWTFTVSSAESISSRLVAMWDETKTEVGDGAPSFTVDTTELAGLANVVSGTFETPSYLSGDGSTGSVLNNEGDPTGIPVRNGTLATEFVCTVPVTATAERPAPFVLYGHGLLGSRSEVLGIGGVGAAAGIGFCAIDFIGMSTTDLPSVAAALEDLTGFRTQADRLQQGHLAWLLLGRLLASDEGFATAAPFRDGDGASVIDHDQLSFLGASQGGILGAASTALSDDLTQVILAVPGMGYNLLLPRSIDFDEFSAVFNLAYPSPLDRMLARELMEMLWDRGENAGWAQHLTRDPYDGATEKNVLILAAFGDHQVANVSTDKLARTLGVPLREPGLAPGRSTDVDPFFGIDPIGSLPHVGSGYVMWDFGTPAPPTENAPPREGEDPHGKLSDVPEALAIVADFIGADGVINDLCAGGPCQTLAE